jgi:Flp pilus assembly protein TadG
MAAVFIALMIFVLTAMASFAVDLGYAWVTQNELQNIADAGALAATRQLGVVYAELNQNSKRTRVDH